MKTHCMPLLGLGLLLVGCGSQTEPSPSPGELPRRQARTTAPMPDDFAVTVGSGGGFAGTWHSTRIAADGTVTTSSSGPGEDAPDVVARLAENARVEIWRELQRVGFFGMKGEPGNMSTGITVTANGRTTSVVHEMDSCPPEFNQLVAFVFARARSATPVIPDCELRLEVKFIDGPMYGQCQLQCTVTNVSEGPLRVPSGASAAAYMDAPFGLELGLRDAGNRRYFPDPGAGGPALPIGPEHFITLAPEEWFVRNVAIGRWFTGNRGADTRTLGHSPGHYTARLRWLCDAEADGTDQPPIWRGATDQVELSFEVQ